MISINTLGKYILICAGSISLALGFLGLFLPVLPTTPFLLLSAWCYIRSSKWLYAWLINHPFCGAYIYNYLTYRAVSRRIKVGALFLLWTTLIITSLIAASLYLTIVLVLVGIGVSIHLIALKTLDRKLIFPR